MPLIDTLVVIGIVLFGIFAFYKALKEPVDSFIGWIKSLIEYIKEKSGEKKDETMEIIRYG